MFPLPPLRPTDTREGLQKTTEAVHRIMDGKINSTGTVTLTASVTTTTVTDFRVGADTTVILSPITANAAAEIGNGTIYHSSTTAGTSFVLTHANNAQTDRDFRYTLLG